MHEANAKCVDILCRVCVIRKHVSNRYGMRLLKLCEFGLNMLIPGHFDTFSENKTGVLIPKVVPKLRT